MAETSGLRTTEVKLAVTGLILIIALFALASLGTVYRSERDRQQRMVVERIVAEKIAWTKQAAEARNKRQQQLFLSGQKAAAKQDAASSGAPTPPK